MAVLPAGFATLKYKKRQNAGIQNAGRKGVSGIAMFLRSAHSFRSIVRQSASLSFHFTPFNATLLSSLFHFIHFAHLRTAQKEKTPSTSLSEQRNVPFPVPHPICNRSNLFSSGRERGTPRHLSERSVTVASLSFARPQQSVFVD